MFIFKYFFVAWGRFKELLGIIRKDRLLWYIFLTLLFIDMCWILWFGFAKVLYESEINEDLYEIKYLRITKEGSYPEKYNYVKTAVLILLLGYLTVKKPVWIYAALTILFTVIVLDDSMEIHEKWGEYFVDRFDIEPIIGLRAQDVGELIAWSILGAILMPMLLFGFFRSHKNHLRNGLAMMVPFAALLFCAVFVDQLYSNFHDLFFGSGILLDMIEDGGEMIIMTIATMMAAALVKHGPDVN